jgi:pimeloyl-ACP methyl ester carboxylesterase
MNRNILVILFVLLLISCQDNSRPQEPSPPFSYLIEEVRFENMEDNSSLAGTITIPKNTINFPTVILVSGSGLQDRDETVYGHKPFKVLAHHLTSNGIAVLRYDERSVGESTGSLDKITTETFAEDAYAGIKFLQQREDINPSKIGIIGHSEGGLVGSILASKYSDISFLVLLAAPGVPICELLIEAHENKLRKEGKSEPIVQSGSELLARLFEQIKKGEGYTKTKKALAKIVNEWRSELTGEVKDDFEDFIDENPKWIKYMTDEWATKWCEYISNLDPRTLIEKVSCPVLALNGNKDIQVVAETNLSAIEKSLVIGGNKSYEIHHLENLNHLFQNCNTGFRDEYGEIEETFSPLSLTLISEWIQENIK